MSTQPDDSYPSRWRPACAPVERVVDDEIDECVANLSDRELQALLVRTRGRR